MHGQQNIKIYPLLFLSSLRVSSQILIHAQQTTQCRIPEDTNTCFICW